MEKSDTTLPCTLAGAKFVCSSAEVNIYSKINLDHNPQKLEIHQALNKLCEGYKDIFLLHQGDIGCNKLLTTDIGTGDYPPITEKLYTLLLKCTQVGP